MASVNLNAVSKRCDKNAILNDINLHIENGEFVAVVGPSGCGKTTLLRLVAGLDSVTSGNILINNQCMNKIPPASRDMAMVFQNYALYPHMTVYENMAYGLKMRGVSKREIKHRVDNVGEMLQISDYLHRKPIVLSGGQRQRVAMGRAIVRSPAVFLFDEPLSNLDAKLRTEMRHEIKKLHQKLGTTCLYVTHDQTEAMTMADRVVVLNKGHVEQVGTPRELYHYPATLFVASFIGHYQMNLISAKVDLKRGVILTDVGVELPIPVLNNQAAVNRVVIGIRPEHLHITSEPTSASLSATIDFIDDMGADKLVHVVTNSGNVRLSLRVSGDMVFAGSQLQLSIETNEANLYCQQTGKRLGGWRE